MGAALASIMAGLEARLATITGLRTFEYPPASVPVPAALVGFPESIEYDTTMARGADRWSIPILVLVSRASERTARTRLGQYLDSTGATSIKTAIEADKTLGGVVHTTRVVRASTIGSYIVNDVDYVGATFIADVVG